VSHEFNRMRSWPVIQSVVVDVCSLSFFKLARDRTSELKRAGSGRLVVTGSSEAAETPTHGKQQQLAITAGGLSSAAAETSSAAGSPERKALRSDDLSLSLVPSKGVAPSESKAVAAAGSSTAVSAARKSTLRTLYIGGSDSAGRVTDAGVAAIVATFPTLFK
jgi:hypothetical protein